MPTAFLQIDSEFGPHARPIVTWNVADKKVFSRPQIDGQCVGFAGIKLRNLALVASLVFVDPVLISEKATGIAPRVGRHGLSAPGRLGFDVLHGGKQIILNRCLEVGRGGAHRDHRLPDSRLVEGFRLLGPR